MEQHIRADADDDIKAAQSRMVADADNFVRSLKKEDQIVFNMLSFKSTAFPLLFKNRLEEDVIEEFMPDLYGSLSDIPYLKDSFAKSCFGQMVSIPVFSSLISLGLPQVLDGQPLNEVEALIMQFLPKHIRSTPQNISQTRNLIKRMTNLSAPGIFGGVANNGIQIPQFHFPILTFTNQNDEKINKLMMGGPDSVRDFLRVVKALTVINGAMPDSENALYTALRNAYQQDQADGDSEYQRIRLLIDAEQEDLANPMWRHAEYLASLGLDLNQAWNDLRSDLSKRLQELKTAAKKVHPEIRRLGFDEIERRLRNAEQNLSRNDLSVEVQKAILRYNRFANSLQKHISNFLSVENYTKETENRRMPISSVSDEKKKPLFDSIFSPDMFENTPGNVGVLKHLQDDMSSSKKKWFFVPGGWDSNDRHYDPYWRVDPQLFLFLDRLDPKLSIALSQRIYSQSLVNLFKLDSLELSISKDVAQLSGDEKSVYLFQVADFQMNRQLKVGKYTPVYNIGRIDSYAVDSDKKKFDTASIKDYIPEDKYTLIDSEQKLKNRFIYDMYRGFYMTITNDLKLSKQYNGGQEVNARGTKFPSGYPDGQYFSTWANDIRTQLFEPILDRMARDYNLIPDSFKTALLAHGDTSNAAEDGNWKSAINNFKDRLSSVESNILNSNFNAYGIYVNPNMTLFLEYCLMKELDDVQHQDENQNGPKLTPDFGKYGTLESRFSHCLNGRVEGVQTYFSILFPSYMSESRGDAHSNYVKIVKLSSHMAILGILKELFDFRENGAESATYWGYAVSSLGMNGNLFGLSEKEPQYKWAGAGCLRIDFIRQVFALATDKGYEDRNNVIAHFKAKWQHNADVANNRPNPSPDPGDLSGNNAWAAPFSELFGDCSKDRVPDSVQRFINEIPDVRERVKVQAYCECFAYLHDLPEASTGAERKYDYEAAVVNIAKKAISPEFLLEFLLGRDDNIQLVNMVLKAYKEEKRLNVDILELDKVQKKQMLFDAFTDSGLFKKKQAAAH